MLIVSPVALLQEPIRMTRAVIFDLDGTLVDTLDDIAQALNGALTDCGRAPLDRDQIRAWVGDGLPTLCQRAWPDGHAHQVADLAQRAGAHYSKGCLVHSRPYRNIMKTLELLRASGTPMGVLTNKPHSFAMQIIEGLGLVRFFEVVQGYQGEQDKKPLPNSALRMAQDWSRSPGDVLLVGDSEVDIQTARNAGMMAVAATWGFRTREALEHAVPDVLIDDPLEIMRLVVNIDRN